MRLLYEVCVPVDPNPLSPATLASRHQHQRRCDAPHTLAVAAAATAVARPHISINQALTQAKRAEAIDDEAMEPLYDRIKSHPTGQGDNDTEGAQAQPIGHCFQNASTTASGPTNEKDLWLCFSACISEPKNRLKRSQSKPEQAKHWDTGPRK